MSSDSKKKVYLFHGDSDYLIFKELKNIRKDLSSKNISISEMFGSKSLDFNHIYNTLNASDLFLQANAVILRELMDSRSFFPFVEKLTDYINSKENSDNELYIFNSSKILKTSKIYKAINKYGEIKEFNHPKPAEILQVIKKSINITDDAAILLHEYSSTSLFQVKNEIKKLESFIKSRKGENGKVDINDVEAVCIKSRSTNDIWGIGSKYLHCKFDSNNNKLKKLLSDEVEDLFRNEVAAMQILYSFYQYVLNAIKFKIAIDEGKIKSERDAFSYGYFFVKEFYSKRNNMNMTDLMKWNNELLEVEYKIKSGEIEEKMGLRRLMVLK